MIPSRTNLINILVPVKRAIDYAVKIRIAKDGKGVDTTVKHSMVRPRPLASCIECLAQFHRFGHHRTLLTRSVSYLTLDPNLHRLEIELDFSCHVQLSRRQSD